MTPGIDAMFPIHMAGPSVTASELRVVSDAIEHGWYAPDAYRYVEAFESEFAAYHDRRYGLMTPNCTTAIHLALEGLGVTSGDEVVAPECTWIGSTAGITHAGATPVFADIDEGTWCLSRDTVEVAHTPQTAAVIAVDLYGNMPDWDALTRYSEQTGVPIIEDAAEALGSRYRGVPAGKWGVASVFSFHRTKTLTTGEGGMLLTDDENLFERCRFLRDHGRRPGSYFNEEVAFKYMPSNLQASLGYAQLKRIDELTDIKRRTFERYRSNLEGHSVIRINPDGGDLFNGVWATAAVFSPESGISTEFILEELPKRDVPVRPFFYPLSSLPAYEGVSVGPDVNPVAYSIASRGIHLPCAMNLTDSQIDYISEQLLEVVGARA
jgi:perosamine synthetase